MQAPEKTEKPVEIPPVGVVFDCDMAGIDDALALALLYGLDGKREARVTSISLSHPSVPAAAFCDAVARFYAGAAAPFMRMLPIGMELKGKPVAPESVFTSVLAKPEYKHTIAQNNDTADPSALIRNALTSQYDGNCLAVLTGPANNFLRALSVPGVKELAAKKIRLLVILPEASDVENTSKLLAQWPGPIAVASPDIGEQTPYPASSIETGFAWTQAHPIVDAYKAYKPMPYDAPTGAMAAILYAVRPLEGYFKVSEPGVITVLEGGKLKLTSSPQGKHRLLLSDPAQKERILKAYTELASAKPVPRFPRFRQMEEKKEEKKAETPKPAVP